MIRGLYISLLSQFTVASFKNVPIGQLELTQELEESIMPAGHDVQVVAEPSHVWQLESQSIKIFER